MKKNFILLIILFSGLFLPKNAYAQEAVALGVYPPIIQIDTLPPASMKTPVVIKNLTNDPISVSVSMKPFKSSPQDNGEIEFLSPSDPLTGEDPLIFQKIQLYDADHVATQIDLAPQEEKTLDLHVGIPDNEPPSDYYFTILFTAKGIGNDQSTLSAISGSIGSNVILSIGPHAPSKGFIKEFSTPWFVQHGPIPFIISLQNDSDHFIIPRGGILISNMFGQYIGKVNLTPVNVLQHSSRFLPDDGNPNSTNATWNEKFLLGLYAAKLNVALSSDGPIYTKTIYFFAMPIEGFIGLVVIIIGGSVIFVRVRHKLKQL